MTQADRRTRWRRLVLRHRAPRLTGSVRVLLLVMADHMDERGYVSVPRSRLAETLAVAPARVSERIGVATSVGLLAVVRRARPGVTAVYQATLPAPVEVHPSVPPLEVRNPVTVEVHPSVPTAEPVGVRTGGKPRSSARAETVTPAAVAPSLSRTPNPAVKKRAPAGEVSHASPSPDAHPEHPDDQAFLRAV